MNYAQRYNVDTATAYRRRRRQHAFQLLFLRCIGAPTRSAVIGHVDDRRVVWKRGRRSVPK